jgi:hypothetical protein
MHNYLKHKYVRKLNKLIGELTNCTVFISIQDSPPNTTKTVNKTNI